MAPSSADLKTLLKNECLMDLYLFQLCLIRTWSDPVCVLGDGG